jgi:hypothetical protein|tara:strand:+ start:853 stop:996 length:144 start_codon:yes stop_codon:yes gene_type:complete
MKEKQQALIEILKHDYNDKKYKPKDIKHFSDIMQSIKLKLLKKVIKK